jgi:Uma2 family endonuclease
MKFVNAGRIRYADAMDKTATHWLTWDEMCANPFLRDLPFKIELNGYNQIVMAPANALHSRLQGEILHLLRRFLKGGKSIPELALQTADNVKVPDAVWASRQMIKSHAGESAWTSAPEICVEVLSPTNTKAEIDLKRGLYFERGAAEVWVCDQEGGMRFYSPEGELERSALCPKFPRRVKL